MQEKKIENLEEWLLGLFDYYFDVKISFFVEMF